MRGRDRHDEEFERFVAARNQDLHHDAYQLTAAQQPAEQLVATVLADMRRERTDLTRAGMETRLRMARIAVRDDDPSEISDISRLPERFHVLARLSPQQRAVLLRQVIDSHDAAETARSLRLSSRAVTEARGSIPYDELPDAAPHFGELRSLLEDFGDFASVPDPATTIADVYTIPPPPRRPWWTYVAAFLVIVLTIASLVVSQRRYDEWANGPEGLNHIHGTHFPAYTAGYELAAIHDVKPGPPTEFSVGGSGAVTLDCTGLRPGLGISSSSQLDEGTYFIRSCSPEAQQPQLVPASGSTSVSINDSSRGTWPVAVYRKVSWSDYPVATEHFRVSHDKTLDDLRRQTDKKGRRITPVAAGPVLTVRGTVRRHNGTFTGQLEIPSSAGPTELDTVGLLSPTTTGRFRIQVNHGTPWVNCASNINVPTSKPDLWCALYDRRIPQVDFSTINPSSTSARNRRITVELTVQHARGPWTLQVAADRYKRDASAVDDGANG